MKSRAERRREKFGKNHKVDFIEAYIDVPSVSRNGVTYMKAKKIHVPLNMPKNYPNATPNIT